MSTPAPFRAIAEGDMGARVEKSYVIYFGVVYSGAEVGKILLDEVPDNRYDYTLPLSKVAV